MSGAECVDLAGCALPARCGRLATWTLAVALAARGATTGRRTRLAGAARNARPFRWGGRSGAVGGALECRSERAALAASNAAGCRADDAGAFLHQPRRRQLPVHLGALFAAALSGDAALRRRAVG